MLSFVSKRYTRGESGTESLVVCLSEYLPLRTVYIIVIKVEGFVLRRDYVSRFFCFQMSFRPTCCPRGKRHSKHEINRYAYPP